MRDARAHVDQITAADQLFKRAHAQLRHQFAHFFGHEEEIIHHVLRLTSKAFAQHGILRCHAHRTGVQVTFTHHDATLHHQWRGRKTELFRTEQRTDDHVATGFHLTIDLNAHA